MPVHAGSDRESVVVRDLLAEQLLAKVMGWTQEDVARERPDLQAMASYNYDEYQQFSPGMRFVESLALWLRWLGVSRASTVLTLKR